MFKKIISIFLSIGMLVACVSCNGQSQPKKFGEIKNVILLIGDGMGPNQIRAGELYKEEKLFMQTIEQSIKVETYSKDGVTDSAAAATALSTGTRTHNGRVGIDGEGNELRTLVDIAHGLGKRTGVITTEELYGATPMGFSGHSLSRNNASELMLSAATSSNVDLFSAYKFSNNSFYLTDFAENGYEIITDANEFSTTDSEKVMGTFQILAGVESMIISDLYVSFDGLVSKALDFLSKDEDGFFLMAEGAHIDHGGHNNDITYMLEELLSFDDMVKYVVNWASKRDDTVVLVTADHETGGLQIEEDAKYGELFEMDEYGNYKNFRWTTGGHTAENVWLFAYAPQIDFKNYSTSEFDGIIRNVDVFKIANAYLSGELVE